jgi:hypothetical protein
MAHHDTPMKLFWPDRTWCFSLLFVLFFAGILRYVGYGYSLPYIEDPEEARLNVMAQDVLETGKMQPEDTSAPYPLGLIGLQYALLAWAHVPGTLPSTILPFVRLISATIGLASVGLIALLGYRISTPQAGLAAAVLWAVMPNAVNVSRTGAADNFVTFFLLLALFLTFSGTFYNRNQWVLWGCAALMLATLFSYQVILLAPLLLLIPLERLRGAAPEGRKSVLRNLGDQVFLFTLFVIWLLWLSPLVVSIKMGRWSAAFEDLTLLAWERNLLIPFDGIGWNVAWVAGLAGLGWLLWPRFRAKVWIFGLGAVAVFGIAWAVAVCAEYTQDFEHLMLISALLSVIGGIGLAGWGEVILRVLLKMRPTISWVGDIGIVVLVIAGSVPSIQASIADMRQHVLPDRRNTLAVWADTTLEGANHIADPSDDRVLNAMFGGYRGLSMFPMIETALVTDRPLEEWRSRAVVYAVVPYVVYQDMQSSADGQADLAQMVLLKSYTPSPDYRDEGMAVFRLYPMQYPADANLGPIHLIGYDLDRTVVAPGETLTIRYYPGFQSSLPIGCGRACRPNRWATTCRSAPPNNILE